MDCRLIEGEMGGECVERTGRNMWMLSEREFFKGFVNELGGDLEEAVNQYLLDAERCRREGRNIYASISYASAARCMKILGDYERAAKCYLMAANMLRASLGRCYRADRFIRERTSRYVSEALKLLSTLSERD